MTAAGNVTKSSGLAAKIWPRTTRLVPFGFGFSLSSGAAADAVRRVLAQPQLDLAGLRCHLGSQITELPAFELAARRLIMLSLHQRSRGRTHTGCAARRRPASVPTSAPAQAQ